MFFDLNQAVIELYRHLRYKYVRCGVEILTFNQFLF